MKKIQQYILAVSGMLMVGMLFSACKAKGDFPGRAYMPDMQYSQAYETYSGTVDEFGKGDNAEQTVRRPPKGTIPHGSIPSDEAIRGNESMMMSYVLRNSFYGFAQDSTYTHYYNLTQTKLVNPVPYSDAALKHGKDVYVIYCQVCHGEKGGGDGVVPVTSNENASTPYPRPPDFKSRLPQLTDGNMYFTISYGKGNMGSYAAQVKPEDRWYLVHYIKSLAGMSAGQSGGPAAAADSTVAAVMP